MERVRVKEKPADGANVENQICSMYCLFIRDESGAVVEPESELQKDEEEEENSLLCDPEEMDLLGEIFDTLSSRSSHERGLLYSTRSLDLFGPDSHDYILKVRSKSDTHINKKYVFLF